MFVCSIDTPLTLWLARKHRYAILMCMEESSLRIWIMLILDRRCWWSSGYYFLILSRKK